MTSPSPATRFGFSNYFLLIVMFNFVTVSESSYFTNRHPTKFKVFIIMKTCRATMSAPRGFRCRPYLPKYPPLQGLNSTSQYPTLPSPHICFSLLLTSTLLLSNASLRSCLGKIPNTTTSPVSPPSASESSPRTSSQSPPSHPYANSWAQCPLVSNVP